MVSSRMKKNSGGCRPGVVQSRALSLSACLRRVNSMQLHH